MKRLFLATAAAAALLAGAPSLAFAQQPAAAEQSLEVAPLGFQLRTLSNGLQVWTRQDSSTANVTVQVWYRVGSKDDPQDRSGFAHLFEHIMFKATRNLPEETFDRLTEDVGGFNNASTYDDFTNYYEVIPANHLERMLFAESERMGSLVVNQESFTSETAVVQEELRQRYLASPYGRLFGLYMPREIYREHPYRRPGIGSLENLAASTIEDVRRFHETYYRPDNAVLIVAGDFDQAQLDAWVDQYFGGIENPDRPVPANNVVEPATTGPREATYYAPNVPLPAVVVAWHTVPYGHPDRAALTVLDGILSTGESSRMYRSMVYEAQIAAQASSIPDFAQQAGNLAAYSLMSDGHTVQEGEDAIMAEIARFRDEPVTQAELDEAKTELIAGILRGREGIDAQAFDLGYALMMTGDASTADTEVARIQAVTAEDVMRVARQYLTPDRRIVVRYLNESEQPEGAPAEPTPVQTEAPVTLADLATDFEIVELAPEGERVPMPQPGPEREVETPAVVERVLSNGLRVYVARTEGLPLVSARLSFDAGASDDPQGREGVASMTAALITQGAAGRSAPEIATDIERLGAAIGASAGPDFTSVYANSPSNTFAQTFALMTQLVRQPDFAQEELDRTRDQTLDALRVSLSQPGPIASAVVARAVYGDAPYGDPSGGTLDSLPTIDRETVAAFHAANWNPASANLVFSGDIDPETAFALAEQAFGDWRVNAAASASSSPAGAPVTPRVIVVDLPGSGQAAVSVAGRAISRTDQDYFRLLVGNAVMGGGYSARLNREIRIRRGLSYGAGSSFQARQDEGYVVASTQTRNDAAAEVVSLILAEITRLSAERATDDEMGPRRATLVGGFARSLETVDGLGGAVASLANYGLPMTELQAYAPNVRAVTPEQIQRFAASRLGPHGFSIVVVGDAAQFLDAIRAAHPNVEVIPVGELDLDTAALR
ncbi:pitrilysin family protein [Brevundimonas sp.]|uniref:M16 family metallopeptidase n=1 Tax=Brevundimonas sp. TaxID=1871086 RepID=UPI0025F2ED5D|nr:pitrilysin family protein [Brevundimonas sp.]